MKKIVFLTISGRNGASSRQRVYEYLPYFMDAHWQAVVIPAVPKQGRGLGRLFGGILEEFRLLRDVMDADVVFIQKRLFGAGFIRRLVKPGRRLVFDFDDAIFTSPKGDWSPGTVRKVEKRLSAVISSSDLAITGNGFLGQYATRTGAVKVEVIPTGLNVSRYKVKSHSGPGLVIGWIGASVNYRYIDMLAGVLPRFAEEHPGTKLLVVSDKDYSMPGVEVINRRWSEATESNDLLDMDIGIMPLEDNDWTRGKCAYKALQYMASGVPAVCSAVGANNEVVTDGVDGFLVTTEDEWFDRINRLIGDAATRERMGSMGRKKIVESYSLEALGKRLVRVIGEL